jgi:hypothetical protein
MKDMIVNETVGCGITAEILPVIAANASSVCGEPENSVIVLNNTGNSVVGQSIPGGVMNEIMTVEPIDSMVGSKPEITVLIFQHRQNHVVGETILAGVIDDVVAVEATEASAVCAAPQVSMPVLIDEKNLGLSQPLFNGIYFKIVVLRLYLKRK